MDALSLLGRALVVFLLLAVTLWLVRRGDGLKRLRRSQTPLEVLGSARLGKGASVALVRIGDADYALGVTDQAVSLLTEAELADDPAPEPPAVPRPARPGLPAALQAQLGLLTRRGHGSRAQPDRRALADGGADTDFEELLAAATAPVGERAPDEDATGVGGPDGGVPRHPLGSGGDRRTGRAATAAPPVSAGRPSGRSTGARGTGSRVDRAAGQPVDEGERGGPPAGTGRRRAVRGRTSTSTTAADGPAADAQPPAAA